MKPYLEKPVVIDDASFSMVHNAREPIPFEWHHHPEYELTLTTNSRGHRFIGEHVGAYGDGDLVMVGPHLPHSWASSSKIDSATAHHVRVLKFRPEWVRDLTAVLTELHPIHALFERAARGLKFSDAVAARVRPEIEAIFSRPSALRVLDLISILVTLSADARAEPLTAPKHASTQPSTQASNPKPLPTDARSSRIDRVLEHVHAHYRHPLTVDELAGIAALSASAFHRMFLRQTRSTLIEYLKRLRIGAACAQLVVDERPIAGIAEAVGYRSLANFGRQFKALKGRTPREYREQFNLKAMAARDRVERAAARSRRAPA